MSVIDNAIQQDAKTAAPLLALHRLSTYLGSQSQPVRAVDDVSLQLRRGETFVLLGESGCGKSMIALSIMRLLPHSGRIVAGDIRLDGQSLRALSEAEMRAERGGRVGMIFQEPMTSLNPVYTCGTQIIESLSVHSGLGKRAARERAIELLDLVGLPSPKERVDDFPHQLSGGQRQRVMIALALANDPDLLIADEPTTALDVTIQAQIIELVKRLKEKMGMAIIWITHDLGVVAEIADRVAVMYLGKIAELTDVDRQHADGLRAVG